MRVYSGTVLCGFLDSNERLVALGFTTLQIDSLRITLGQHTSATLQVGPKKLIDMTEQEVAEWITSRFPKFDVSSLLDNGVSGFEIPSSITLIVTEFDDQ